MIVEIRFVETSIRRVRVRVSSLAEAERIWNEPVGDEDVTRDDWIDESSEGDGGIDWESATFRELPREGGNGQ